MSSIGIATEEPFEYGTMVVATVQDLAAIILTRQMQLVASLYSVREVELSITKEL